MARKWSKRLVLEEIIARHTADKPLNYANVVADDEALTGAARRLFGSWGKAVEAAGFDYETIKKEARIKSNESRYRRGFWDKETILDEIKELFKAGVSLAPHTVQIKYPKLYSAAVAHFKSWGKAVEAAGFDYLEHRKTREWNPEKIIEKIKHAHNRGADLSDKTVNTLAPDLYGAAHEHFGSWPKAVEAAGLDYATICRTVRWGSAKIIDMIRNAAKTGKPLSIHNFPTSFLRAVKNNFGSWENALAEAGYGEKPWQEIDESIINHIREHRSRLGLSTTELGRRLGVSHRTISMLELSQVIDPRVSFALKLAEELDCRVEDLFKLPEGKKSKGDDLGEKDS